MVVLRNATSPRPDAASPTHPFEAVITAPLLVTFGLPRGVPSKHVFLLAVRLSIPIDCGGIILPTDEAIEYSREVQIDGDG